MTPASTTTQHEAEVDPGTEALAPRAGRTGTSRINVILPTEMLEDLRATASREGITLTEILRYAIGLSGFADRVREDGGRLMIERSDGRLIEIAPRFTAAHNRRPTEASSQLAEGTVAEGAVPKQRQVGPAVAGVPSSQSVAAPVSSHQYQSEAVGAEV